MAGEEISEWPLHGRAQVMRLTEAAAARIRESWRRRTPGRGLARRRQEWRLRRHGLHDGICRERRARPTRWSRTRACKLLIDPKAVLFLLGTEMDYKTDKLSSQFVFNNPNQTSACGCGKSVQLRPRPGEAGAEAAMDAEFIRESGFRPVGRPPHGGAGIFATADVRAGVGRAIYLKAGETRTDCRIRSLREERAPRYRRNAGSATTSGTAAGRRRYRRQAAPKRGRVAAKSVKTLNRGRESRAG